MSISRFFLVVETCDMNIYELYERLLSIMIPKIQYIGFLKNDTLLNNFNVSGKIESRGLSISNNGILQSKLSIMQRLAPLRSSL